MIVAAPSVAEERAVTLRESARGWRKEGLISGEELARVLEQTPSPWRASGPFATVAFFFLTVLGLGAFAGFVAIFGVRPVGLPVAIVAIAAAEWLIRTQRLFATGIEAALWIGGLVALITTLPSSGDPEEALVFAAAFALAGARLRNPYFGALAAVGVIVYADWKSHWNDPWPPVIAGVAIALVAALALTREWRRPSTDNLFAATLLVSPLAAAVAAFFDRARPELALPFVLLLAVTLAIGIARRDRVELIAAGESLAIALYAVHETIPFANETQLIVAGIVMALAAALIARLLRGATRGFVAVKTSGASLEDAIQIAGTIAAAPHHDAPPPAAPAPQPGGGSFGGAGASGDF